MRLPLQINSAGKISAQEQTVRVADRLFGLDTPIFLITYQNCKMIYCSVINLDRKGDSFFVSRSMRIPCVMGLNEADNRVKNIAIKFMAKNIPFIRYFYTKAMLVI